MHHNSFWLVIFGLVMTTLIQSQSISPVHGNSSEFSAPVDIPILLSGNFGEIRSVHFHSGIDIKTEQVEGKNVLAAAEGFVYRVAVQSGGYGHAVYLRHPGGKVTVYCHLSEFEPELKKYVSDQQYRKKSFEVDLYPDDGLFHYNRGDQIGLSGNTGNSGGPHLHFEIRDRTASIPLNPLNYGFAISDKTRPKIKWLMIYPQDDKSKVNGLNQKMSVQVNGRNGNHYIVPDTIGVNGRIGIGVETYDYLDNSSNECGPYTIALSLDGAQVFLCRIDSIPFSAAGYVNSHIDYEEKMRSGRKVQKLFIDPNNQLKIYKVALDRGIIQLEEEAVHKVRITVRDTYGNESELVFHLQSTGPVPAPVSRGKDSLTVARFGYDSINVFELRDIRLAIPKGALFDDISFRYAQFANDSVRFSAIHHVHDRYTPLFRSYILSLRPHEMPVALHSKALIASRGSNGKWVSQGGDYKNGFVTTKVKVFGQFIVMVDTVSPVINPVRFKAGGRYAENDIISFTMADSLSGIRKYAGYIDKNWVLFEYDAKSDGLSYRIDGTRLVKNQLHQVELYVTDNKDNVGRFKSNFYY